MKKVEELKQQTALLEQERLDLQQFITSENLSQNPIKVNLNICIKDSQKNSSSSFFN